MKKVEKKAGFTKEAGEADVSDISANRLAEIQKEVEQHGIDLNVDVKTGRAKPKITAILKKGTKLPKQKPL
ncbi:MAG: hypothetical protein UY17_C0016G0008 [Candidatus Beckwithbacteria bacterium GW2011_GWC2_47_9]|uniref:Uncharacterized protein n=1 Tax=Candidatus Beckwithbacteria bacterium GW2011_GWC2_47_9 TaxID=1618373 RepID=A0A0G1WB16_9BACT|nr:MAG: hypothetical protein UY17_C0016G0008 [Candidatus Beckwithbacteria bacterium GW2011_GWC2_47_9]